MRKTRRSRGRHAEFYVIELSSAADQPTEFRTGEELTAEQREHFWSLLYEDFPELLQPVDSPQPPHHAKLYPLGSTISSHWHGY
jgi:hypothetical protein